MVAATHVVCELMCLFRCRARNARARKERKERSPETSFRGEREEFARGRWPMLLCDLSATAMIWIRNGDFSLVHVALSMERRGTESGKRRFATHGASSPGKSDLKEVRMEHKARTQNEKLEVKTTTCYMCACRCGIRVHLRDGEVRYIDGNPDHPLNQGVICAKGSSGIMKQYSPARLTQPLMRKPDALRGTAQFEPVSWDVAFDVLEKRLAHIRATDPKKFA